MTVPSVVTAWVDEVARLTTPDAIVYCDGSVRPVSVKVDMTTVFPGQATIAGGEVVTE